MVALEVDGGEQLSFCNFGALLTDLSKFVDFSRSQGVFV